MIPIDPAFQFKKASLLGLEDQPILSGLCNAMRQQLPICTEYLSSMVRCCKLPQVTKQQALCHTLCSVQLRKRTAGLHFGRLQVPFNRGPNFYFFGFYLIPLKANKLRAHKHLTVACLKCCTSSTLSRTRTCSTSLIFRRFKPNLRPR